MPTHEKPILTPDEVLINCFNDEELQMIADDPNYFIIDEEFRSKINLFENDMD